MKGILGAVVVILVGWELLWWLLGVTPVFPWQLRGMLADPQRAPILLDVRTSLEYNWFHIEGAINRPDVFGHAATQDLEGAHRPIVVVCLSGHRSPIMGYLMMRRGIQDVSYLSWGMLSWFLSGGSVVQGRDRSGP